MPAKNCSNALSAINMENSATTLVSISNNQSSSNSSNSSTYQNFSISLPCFKTTRHFSDSLKQFSPGKGQSDSILSLPLNSANDNIQDQTSMKPSNPEDGNVRITGTPSNRFENATSNSSSENELRNSSGVANLAMAQINRNHLPWLEVCKIDSKRPQPVPTDSGTIQNITDFAEQYQNNGFIEIEHHKPLVIRSSSSLQPAQKADLGQTFSAIRISTRSQSCTSVISETASIKSLTNVSSMGHCTSVSPSVMTKSLPVIHDCGNDDENTVLEGHNLHTTNPMVKTKPTFSSFGIEHDEPLDASIVQRLNERANTSSKRLALSCEADAEKPAFGKAPLQNFINSSETNQLMLNRREEARDKLAPDTSSKEAKKTFLCQVCGKLLNGRSNLKSHLLTHSSARPHVCHVCSKAFCRRHSFHIHMRTHTNENPYKCGRCPAAFKTRSNMVRHEVVHTSRSRDYRCQECGKEFTSKLSLNSHRKVHTVAGPCVCSQCGEAYATMQSLRTHQLHHKYPDKQFKCKLCDKAYVFQSLLKRHMDGHNGVQKFHCHLCSATFAWKSSLAAHILTHYPKKYKCKLCSLSFNTEKRLTSHLKKHSEPNPHSCTLCLKKYPFRYLLVRHVKSAHGHKSFVTVKVKAVTRQTDMVRKIRSTASGRCEKANPSAALQELTFTASTSEFGAEQYPGSNDCSRSVTGSHKSTKHLPFSAVSPKIPMFKFRCVSAQRDHVAASVPRFTVSIGQKSKCPVVTQSNIVKQDPKYEPVVCYPAQRTVSVAGSVTVSSPADICNYGDGSCEKRPPPSCSSSSYREPPPSYHFTSPRSIEGLIEGSCDSHTSFRHSSAEKIKLQSEHKPRSVSSCANELYTPSYETISTSTTFNDLLSPPGLGRYQRCGGPPHPNLLPASSDPYLQAASSAHSAYFPSPQHPAYDSPSSRHQLACGSTRQAPYDLPPNLQANDGSSSPSQQSHGGLMYLATHSDYDLAGCLDDDAFPDGERS